MRVCDFNVVTLNEAIIIQANDENKEITTNTLNMVMFSRFRWNEPFYLQNAKPFFHSSTSKITFE